MPAAVPECSRDQNALEPPLAGLLLLKFGHIECSALCLWRRVLCCLCALAAAALAVQDNWEVHKESFTPDQLTELAELLVSPHYYA